MKVGLCGRRKNKTKLIKVFDFIVIQKKLTLTPLEKHLKIFWEIHGKSLYQVLLSMKLLYQNIPLFADNVLLHRFDIGFNKYLLLKNNA